MRSNNLSDLASADVFQRLLKERIIFLGSAIDETVGNQVCAQLLLLAAEDSEKDINLYVNSPGGSVTDGLAIYDTMQYVSCDVSTICVGLAASMGQFLLCAGSPGKRFALPHSRILMHQPSGSMQGQAADIAIQAEQIIYLKHAFGAGLSREFQHVADRSNVLVTMSREVAGPLRVFISDSNPTVNVQIEVTKLLPHGCVEHVFDCLP